MKIGLIGCGEMGLTHNQCLKELSYKKDVQVTAVSDFKEDYMEKAASLWPNATKFKDGMELIEKAGLDLVFICLPSFLHTNYALAAMKEGMSIFIEKPVCLTELECEKLLAQQEQSGVDVMVGQVVRSTPEYIYLKQLYDEKTFGNLRSVSLRRLGGDPKWGVGDWFHDEKKSGSVVLDLHIHDIDFLRYVLGEPDDYKVKASCFDNGMINYILTEYTFGSVTASAEGEWNISSDVRFEAGYRAEFDEAAITYDNNSKNKITVFRKDGRMFTPNLHIEFDKDVSTNGLNDPSAYYLEDQYFLDKLSKREPNTRAPLSEGVKSVLQAIREYDAAKQVLKQN